MLFSSITFLLYFFPVVLLGYYTLSFSRILSNIWLLVASLFFYAWGESVYVLLMIGSILFNSIFALLIDKSGGALKKIFLIIALVGNIGVLFVFKYLTFVLGFFGSFGTEISGRLPLTLPIGISFYTFQAISYVIDVFRGTTQAENPFYVGLYIAFFPQLIAGPIVQYSEIADQLRRRKNSFDKLAVGIARFSVGFGKKVLLANNFAMIADDVFDWSLLGVDKMVVPATLAWVGSIAYTLQIYFDFSGYSDMAIGLGLCFGFRFPENFNYPYIATGVSDFWRRWHISLTNWFRNYVYFPLGGNRTKNRDTMVRNMFVVWLLTGIWHGANWTFIFWGLFYFLFQLAERFTGFEQIQGHTALKRLYTLLVVNFLWVLFRAQDMYQAGRFIMNMLMINNNGFWSSRAWMLVRENFLFFVCGIVFATPVIPRMNKWCYENETSVFHKIYSAVYPLSMLAMMVLSLSYLVTGSYNPFIYFNF